jgi:hypothetical protein
VQPPQGRDNGARRVAGDTEDIPEMRALKEIDLAFVPMTYMIDQPAVAPLQGAGPTSLRRQDGGRRGRGGRGGGGAGHVVRVRSLSERDVRGHAHRSALCTPKYRKRDNPEYAGGRIRGSARYPSTSEVAQA